MRQVAEIAKAEWVSADQVPLLEKVADTFSMSITPEMQTLIGQDLEGPIAKQFIPSVKELVTLQVEQQDPIGDQSHSPLKGIVHRYPDRCLLMPVQVCPVYCRFCFRREKVSQLGGTLTSAELNQAYAYIQSHKEIWEVIFSGGDPLILKPKALQSIFTSLDPISHVEVLRIHTRIPVVDSKKINQEMMNALKNTSKTLYIILHVNHPKEFTEDAIEAIAKLADAGIPLLSQTVLLKDINDNIDTLSELMRLFVKHRIKPYYLHHGDLAKGTAHFRTSIKHGQALMHALRGRFSGLCQPTYVLDIPGGYGKVPIHDCYWTMSPQSDEFIISDYKGKKHIYRDH